MTHKYYKIISLQKKYQFLFRSIFLCIFYFQYSVVLVAGEIGNLASKSEGDTIEFSGYKWVTKESYERRIGPGNNFFSSSNQNVFVDNNGKLHLRLVKKDNKWYCPEVRLAEKLGYGNYFFNVDSLPQSFDKNIVVGLFVYDMIDTTNSHNEIDIEFSQWGKDSILNSQYVIQPQVEKAYRFHSDLSFPTRHKIVLKKRKITFCSGYLGSNSDKKPFEYATRKLKPSYIYNSKDERVIMNVWLYNSIVPENINLFEVIISRFEFKTN